MINTDTESNYWPWRWIHDGEECNSSEDYKQAWSSIDPFRDSIFRPSRSKHTNRRGDDLERKVSENIVCVHDQFKITDKISLADYQDYAIKKFDSQMEKIANKHPKLVVAMSGGIDSSMVFSWCVKNKVDMEAFTWQHDAWKGAVNNIMEQKVMEMGRLANVPITLFDLGSGQFNMDKIMTEYCEAEIFEFPHMHYATQGNGWINACAEPSGWGELFAEYDGHHRVMGLGTDELFLHRPETYVRLIPKEMVNWLREQKEPPVYMANKTYRVGGMWGDSWPEDVGSDQPKQTMRHWDEMGFLGHLSGKESWPAATKEWVQAWHNIEPNSCTAEQFNDMINVGWLKRTIVDWAGDSWVDMIHSVPCTEKYYKMSPELRKYILSQVDTFVIEYNKAGMTAEALQWAGWKKTLQYFNKLSPAVLEQIHTLNWFLKHQK